ncbi:hypothetical protein [Photobacterium damselae]|uniref:hypothetical protein n=1 Tax=Photobacterium damselae TaxID=38293 RepID=UPI00406762F2
MMKSMLNERIFIGNLSYKLNRDKNIVSYLEKIPTRMKNFENLEHMEKYYFSRDTMAIAPLLDLFNSMMVNYSINHEISGEKLMQDCRVFPDSTGRTILRLLGYYQLIRAAHELFKYEEMFKDNSYSESSIRHQKKHQQYQLSPSAMFYSHFIKPSNYMDFESLSQKLEFEKTYFESKRKPQLMDVVDNLLKQYEPSNLSQSDFFTKCGLYALDTAIEKKQNESSAMSKALESIINALSNNVEETDLETEN